MKKVLALVLSVLMILSLFSVSILAEELQAEEPESVEEVLAETPEDSGWTSPVWNGYKTAARNEVKIGDVNNDGIINVLDANIVRRVAAKLNTLNDNQIVVADVNSDGSIDVLDANLIRCYAAKLITSFIGDTELPEL